MTNIIINQAYEFEIALIDRNGDFDTSGTVSIEIENTSTGATEASGTMTVQGDVYKFTHTFTSLGQFRALYTTPSGFKNGLEAISIVNSIEDSVWDEALASHLTAGSTGEALDDIKDKTDNLPPDPAAESNATTNTNNIIAEIDANELKIDAIATDITAHRNAVEISIRNILGLTQENTQIKDTVYDSNDNLISAKIRLYSNSTDATNDTNHFKEYSMTATYDAQGRMTKYVVTD